MKPMVKHVIGAIAVASALASVVAGRENSAPQVVEPVSRVDTRLQTREDIDLAKLEARVDEGAKIDAFAPKSFAPAAAPQQAAPSAKREAPALPFKYVGKMIDNGKLAIFLTNGADSFTVTEGERVGDYRVDQISEAEIRFTYLPMKAKQTLPL